MIYKNYSLNLRINQHYFLVVNLVEIVGDRTRKMALNEYKKKRNLKESPEPEAVLKTSGESIFVVQKHLASHLHYDFRIESNSVLKSWAIPKGPSLNPKVKRLAIETEDHPLDYASFEGIIPVNNYGAGKVMVWDRGTYKNRSQKDNKPISMEDAFKKGHITMLLNGEKLKGEFSLIKMRNKGQWLLVKKADSEANMEIDILESKNKSVLTGKSIEEIENA